MIILVTGGARSGKSSFAESKYKGCDDVVYIATASRSDDEMDERIKHHQETRPSIWRTFEGNKDLYKALGSEKNYLLDCISLLTSNIMFNITKDADNIDEDLQKQVEDTILYELSILVEMIRENNYNLILVTNEVGMSIVPDNQVARAYRDILGRVNQRLASISDQVFLVCCGIAVKIK